MLPFEVLGNTFEYVYIEYIFEYPSEYIWYFSFLLVYYFHSLSLESSILVPIVAANSQVLLKSKLGTTFLT